MAGHDGQTLGYDAAGARPFSKEDEPFGPNIVGEHAAQAGLTKREYFAAKALQGILSSATDESPWAPDIAAQTAVAAADALIAALNAKPIVGDMRQITGYGEPCDARR